MSALHRRFHRSLYEEHLEEISALYERRLGLLDDREVDAIDIADLEARIEAHLDALVIGGAQALELCVERAEGDDAGVLFGALCTFFRQGRHDLFESTLARFEPDKEEEDEEDEDDGDGPTPAQALGDALSTEGPPAWTSSYEQLLAEGPPVVAAAVGRMAGVRCPGLAPKVAESAARLGHDPHVGPMLWALGRTRERSAVGIFEQHLQQPERPEAMIATLALLRFGDPAVLEFVIQQAATQPWACSLLAIAGGPLVAPVLHARLSRSEVTPEEIVAVGLFGDIAPVPQLIERLGQGVHPEATAQALHLLTGAVLPETVLEPVDPIEPPPEGSAPADPRDQVEVVRLSQDPEAWAAWWQEHRGALPLGRRYRLGQLASPEVLGQTVLDFIVPLPVRQLAGEEIGLRYWPSRDVDADQWAGSLHAALAGLPALRQTIAVIDKADGAWVFARNLMR